MIIEKIQEKTLLFILLLLSFSTFIGTVIFKVLNLGKIEFIKNSKTGNNIL